MTHETYRIIATTNIDINVDTLVKSESLRETSDRM